MSRRADYFGHEISMFDGLAALHDPHNRRLCLEVPVRSHTFVNNLIFFLRLLQLDLVDLDPYLLISEICVVFEHIILVDFRTSRSLRQYSVLRTCERLEGSF